MNTYLSTIRAIIKRFPAVIPHLKGRARWVAYAYHVNLSVGGWDVQTVPLDLLHEPDTQKTYDFYLSTLQRLVTSVYEGNLSGEFIDIMANLISGQLTQAFEQAWTDEGSEDALPDYLSSALEDMILNQYDYVDAYYRDIQDARIDEKPIDGVLARAELWAQRWTEAYNQATLLIRSEEGGNLEWELGETEEHCPECFGLNGIVARASEWEQLDVHPQGAPNDKISCGGWKCDCKLSPTEKRRSPKAFDTIMNIVSK